MLVSALFLIAPFASFYWIVLIQMQILLIRQHYKKSDYFIFLWILLDL